MDTQIEKILAVINDEPYPFSIEIFPAEEGAIYRATLAQENDRVLNLIPGYIEFDESGNVQPGDINETEQGRAISDGVWRGIKEQVINKYTYENTKIFYLYN